MALKESEIFDILHVSFMMGVSISGIASHLGYSEPTISKYINMGNSFGLVKFECSLKELKDISALFAQKTWNSPCDFINLEKKDLEFEM